LRLLLGTEPITANAAGWTSSWHSSVKYLPDGERKPSVAVDLGSRAPDSISAVIAVRECSVMKENNDAPVTSSRAI
jgi:hypothetical protein